MTVAKAVARALTDPGYKKRLLDDPNAALAEEGVKVPAGKTVKVIENSADTRYLVLPESSSEDAELSTEELEKVAGGTVSYSWCY